MLRLRDAFLVSDYIFIIINQTLSIPAQKDEPRSYLSLTSTSCYPLAVYHLFLFNDTIYRDCFLVEKKRLILILRVGLKLNERRNNLSPNSSFGVLNSITFGAEFI